MLLNEIRGTLVKIRSQTEIENDALLDEIRSIMKLRISAGNPQDVVQTIAAVFQQVHAQKQQRTTTLHQQIDAYLQE